MRRMRSAQWDGHLFVGQRGHHAMRYFLNEEQPVHGVSKLIIPSFRCLNEVHSNIQFYVREGSYRSPVSLPKYSLSASCISAADHRGKPCSRPSLLSGQCPTKLLYAPGLMGDKIGNRIPWRFSNTATSLTFDREQEQCTYHGTSCSKKVKEGPLLFAEKVKTFGAPSILVLRSRIRCFPCCDCVVSSPSGWHWAFPGIFRQYTKHAANHKGTRLGMDPVDQSGVQYSSFSPK